MKTILRYLYVMSAFVLMACGKASAPGVMQEGQYFGLENPKAIFFDSCIIAQVTVTGDTRAVDSISLELTPENTMQTEFLAPFRASETEKASVSVIRTINSKPTITIQYCPKRLPRAGFRMRFRGEHHIFSSPTVYTNIFFVRTPNTY